MKPSAKSSGSIPGIRRQGFAGQHLVVLPEPVRRQAERHALLRRLLVTDAGYFPAAAGHTVERPQGASTHLLILCLRGKGWVATGARPAPVTPGDALWLPPDTAHAYGAENDDPWTIVWAHFRGDEAAAWREELGWPARQPFGLRSFPADHLAAAGLDRVHARLERGYAIPDLLAAATLLRVVFTTLIDLATSAGAARTAAERVASIRDALAADPLRPRRLEELATQAGLSVPHFCTVFRRLTGYSPIDYLIRLRIRAACRLLDVTHDPVAAVAARTGFDDPYYFSRCFRRVMGLSPREYRGTVKG